MLRQCHAKRGEQDGGGRIGWHGKGEEGGRGGGIDQPHSPTAHRCMRGRDPVSGIYSGSAAAFSLPIRESLCI